ncbi:MAG: branched-chain amino acid ABC transporter permease [Lachnospiraceae bacterium]|nr:branched-chain amino acid ABC transporter permease [Lachnospiraceae bacterium]
MKNSLTESFFGRIKGRNKRISPLGLVLMIIGLVFVIVSPMILTNYRLNLIITILRIAYLAQCWNLMSGYCGQFSFGHAAFFGVGAYTSSLLYTELGLTPWVGMIVGMITAGIIGAIIGVLSFMYNLKGDYFALVTLAFAEILRVIAKNSGWLKGAQGVSITFKKDISIMQFPTKAGFVYFALILLVLITAFLFILQKTKMGKYFIAIRENEDAARALGINTFKYKMIALVLSAMLTAIAGTFYAQYYLHIDPEIVFLSSVSVDAIIPCILGGVGTVFGPIIGACIIEPISELTNVYLSGLPGMNMVTYGLILVVVIIVLPNGVLGLADSIKDKLSTKRKAKESLTEE